MVRRSIGKSVRGKPIESFVTGPRKAVSILVLGGFHGDEAKAVSLVRAWMAKLEFGEQRNFSARFTFVPVVNPDGYVRGWRRNGRGVDLNRNFPTENWKLDGVATNPQSRMYRGPKPGSEPETRAIMRVVEELRPACIISVHSINQRRFCNNYDGPARTIANAMNKCNGYPVAASIGYPTPGSFGTWAGVERGIPTITLELPAEHSTKRCIHENRDVPLAIGRKLRGSWASSDDPRLK